MIKYFCDRKGCEAEVSDENQLHSVDYRYNTESSTYWRKRSTPSDAKMKVCYNCLVEIADFVSVKQSNKSVSLE